MSNSSTNPALRKEALQILEDKDVKALLNTLGVTDASLAPRDGDENEDIVRERSEKMQFGLRTFFAPGKEAYVPPVKEDGTKLTKEQREEETARAETEKNTVKRLRVGTKHYPSIIPPGVAGPPDDPELTPNELEWLSDTLGRALYGIGLLNKSDSPAANTEQEDLLDSAVATEADAAALDDKIAELEIIRDDLHTTIYSKSESSRKAAQEYLDQEGSERLKDLIVEARTKYKPMDQGGLEVTKSSQGKEKKRAEAYKLPLPEVVPSAKHADVTPEAVASLAKKLAEAAAQSPDIEHGEIDKGTHDTLRDFGLLPVVQPRANPEDPLKVQYSSKGKSVESPYQRGHILDSLRTLKASIDDPELLEEVRNLHADKGQAAAALQQAAKDPRKLEAVALKLIVDAALGAVRSKIQQVAKRMEKERLPGKDRESDVRKKRIWKERDLDSSLVELFKAGWITGGWDPQVDVTSVTSDVTQAAKSLVGEVAGVCKKILSEIERGGHTEGAPEAVAAEIKALSDKLDARMSPTMLDAIAGRLGAAQGEMRTLLDNGMRSLPEGMTKYVGEVLHKFASMLLLAQAEGGNVDEPQDSRKISERKTLELRIDRLNRERPAGYEAEVASLQEKVKALTKDVASVTGEKLLEERAAALKSTLGKIQKVYGKKPQNEWDPDLVELYEHTLREEEEVKLQLKALAKEKGEEYVDKDVEKKEKSDKEKEEGQRAKRVSQVRTQVRHKVDSFQNITRLSPEAYTELAKQILNHKAVEDLAHQPGMHSVDKITEAVLHSVIDKATKVPTRAPDASHPFEDEAVKDFSAALLHHHEIFKAVRASLLQDPAVAELSVTEAAKKRLADVDGAIRNIKATQHGWRVLAKGYEAKTRETVQESSGIALPNSLSGLLNKKMLEGSADAKDMRAPSYPFKTSSQEESKDNALRIIYRALNARKRPSNRTKGSRQEIYEDTEYLGQLYRSLSNIVASLPAFLQSAREAVDALPEGVASVDPAAALSSLFDENTVRWDKGVEALRAELSTLAQNGDDVGKKIQASSGMLDMILSKILGAWQLTAKDVIFAGEAGQELRSAIKSVTDDGKGPLAGVSQDDRDSVTSALMDACAGDLVPLRTALHALGQEASRHEADDAGSEKLRAVSESMLGKNLGRDQMEATDFGEAANFSHLSSLYNSIKETTMFASVLRNWDNFLGAKLFKDLPSYDQYGKPMTERSKVAATEGDGKDMKALCQRRLDDVSSKFPVDGKEGLKLYDVMFDLGHRAGSSLVAFERALSENGVFYRDFEDFLKAGHKLTHLDEPFRANSNRLQSAPTLFITSLRSKVGKRVAKKAKVDLTRKIANLLGNLQDA